MDQLPFLTPEDLTYLDKIKTEHPRLSHETIMNIKRFTGIVILLLTFTMGCSGNYGKLKTQSADDSKATQKELIDNWSDYDIWFLSAVIVFDPKNDDKKILVGSNWGRVKDQETWTRIVKENTDSDGNISPLWANYAMTGVREIWSPNNQFYGYVIHQLPDSVGAMVVDENTMRLHHHTAHYGAGG